MGSRGKQPKRKLPQKDSAGDAAHSIGKALLSSLPLVGGPAAQFLEEMIVPPFMRRREEWFEALAADVTRLLESSGLSAEALRDEPAFSTRC